MVAPTAVGGAREAERGWFASRWERLNGPERIAGIDLARGLAVIGMIAAHLLWTTRFDFADPSTWTAVVDGRSSIIFATLAGVSIGLVTGGRTALGPPRMRVARLRLVVRAFMLWIIGLLLVVTGVPVYVILPAYALLFLLALPFLTLSARVLLVWAAALGITMPFVVAAINMLPFWSSASGQLIDLGIGWHYPFLMWIAFVLAGLGVARAGILRGKVQGWMLGAGALLAVIGYGLDAATGATDAEEFASLWSAVWTAREHSSGVLEVIGSGGFALAAIAACLMLCRTVLRWVVLPVRAVGAMPLTAYAAQIVIWAVLATAILGDPGDLRGFRDLEPFVPIALAIIVSATVWALTIGRGPLEWVVDRVARLAVPDRRRSYALGRLER